MKKGRFILFVSLILLTVLFLLGNNMIQPNKANDKNATSFVKKDSVVKKKQLPEKRLLSKSFKGDLYHWIDQSTHELVEDMGEPTRKDISPYGYTWWVYTDQKEEYIQFGIEDKKVKTIFAAGENISTEPMKIGMTYEELKKTIDVKSKVTYKDGVNSYQFHLHDEDLLVHPLTQITENVFVENYFDTFSDKLIAVRILTGDVLLKHRAYEIQYRGPLPKEPKLNKKTWKQVETGMERQIFDLSNVFRHYFGKPALRWDDTVREVAYLHSKDMAEHDYFSHYRLDGQGLKERLAEKDVFYLTAGENIAAQYPDAPAAVLGWLNSVGHREALLEKNYTHLGVGVYQFHYTQNFLNKP